MCANCMVEVEDDSPETVVQKAIRRVERTDAGLSRQRWERGVAISNDEGQESPHSSKVRTQRSTRSGPVSQVLQSVQIGHDGIADHTLSHAPCTVPLDSTIYVSIKDPIGLSAFKPSPTKPIPQRMLPPWKMLPSQLATSREVNRRPHPILDDQLGVTMLDKFPSPIIEESETICPTAIQTPTRVLSPQDQEKGVDRAPETEQKSTKSSKIVNSPPIMIPQARGLSFVSTESLQRPSNVSRKSTGDSKSSQGSDLISTPASPHPILSRSSSIKPKVPLISNSHSQCAAVTPERSSPSLSYAHLRTPSPFSQVTAYMKTKTARTSLPRIKDGPEFQKSERSEVSNQRINTASLAVAGRGRVKRIGHWQQQQQQLSNSPTMEEASQGARFVQTRGDLKRNIAQGDLWTIFGAGQSNGK
ncbi:hypothetical protein PFICI_03874 [Pestalotiopsis fici W106-1]|uniref:Uncharacterized protein n=1 Tax=Pestalotiopsis fici (strain W106-1 / CGMCC3.15140) TaxID=1229662 RepID=W3XIL8_PESFW|nr:uncharacterized protein PFICI_03874 [Pestalotiopsis fici W106-1]ETS85849.1 hypothetical protein PFICI_03874 [Pestalotiopsis fici W106-1]